MHVNWLVYLPLFLSPGPMCVGSEHRLRAYWRVELEQEARPHEMRPVVQKP
jgi:hypothetical protein